MLDDEGYVVCESCNFPEWWADNCCERCSEIVEGQ